MFRLLKVAALGALGWVLYRALATTCEECEDDPAPDSPREDSNAEPEPAPAVTAVTAVTAEDDLRKVQGIGPAIEGLLRARGITTWSQLAGSEVSALQAILDEAGPRYRVHDPSTWPAQAAELAQAN